MDEAVGYSSYTFGDPSTPVPRSYVGDPVKWRLLHGGSEVFHVHHLHGGSIRWRRQPKTEDSHFTDGFNKFPSLQTQASTRIDSQSIGPSEAFDQELECGSGGCQQGVGDFLYHCHVVEHYISGMWSFWRVYNTLQSPGAQTDTMPPLQELPDRKGQFLPAVVSTVLIGTTVDWKGLTFDLTKDNVVQFLARQLPPPGVRKGYDGTVFDGKVVNCPGDPFCSPGFRGPLFLTEPETEEVWVNYASDTPGRRLVGLFDPLTGKLAHPYFRPHLAERPPFAPNHGPAPFLEPIRTGTDPAEPGQNGPWSLCPQDAPVRKFTIHAITLHITLNEEFDIVDEDGQLYILHEQEEAIRANDRLKEPLVLRVNAGDCIDIILKSELEDNKESLNFSKVNLHSHFLQFDIQASDGVPTGFGYEQSVRPFAIEGVRVASSARAEERSLVVDDASRFHPRIEVGIGMDQVDTFEVRQIKSISGNTLTFVEPLKFAHTENEIVSVEFVRYRWYADVQVGAVYWHDHVNALVSWGHGLFGVTIIEPPGSTYHDPATGEVVKSGTLADIHTDSTDRVVTPDVTGSFRELVLFVQDTNPRTEVGDGTGSSFNMRVEPLEARLDEVDDPALLFSSLAHGDPAGPILKAYLGDPIIFRLLVGGANETHVIHIDGHWFRLERFSLNSRPRNSIHVGISERENLVIPRAGGPQRMAGDYLFYNGRAFHFKEGSWGIIRVLDRASSSLQSLPGRSILQPATMLCPADALVKSFNVVAIEKKIFFNDRAGIKNGDGKLFVLAEDELDVLSGIKPTAPLVLHVNVGDCVLVNLTNRLDKEPVSFHTDLMAYDPLDSMGIAAGFNPDQSVRPGQTRTYTFYAHPELGEVASLVRDFGNVLENPRNGLFGAIIVGPRGSIYLDPVTGEDVSLKSGWAVDVLVDKELFPDRQNYRDFSLFFQDEDPIIGTHTMPYNEDVEGLLGVNYRAEPFEERLKFDRDPSRIFRSDVHGDPVTPILEAFTGDAVTIHAFVPSVSKIIYSASKAMNGHWNRICQGAIC